jgi:hypothetical protein
VSDAISYPLFKVIKFAIGLMLVVLHHDSTLLPDLIPGEVGHPRELGDKFVKHPENAVAVGLNS